ncbi:hypothetical protein [Halomarina oriensis]|uniref:Uncharacterized protein n=1 Tax=Halomarina oriensis TaxID=671145 RepID=A0A6B0GJU7_9EURY|nr:hypothetical protein [Halomarina oriensis]MWG35196.1 hypothetical protein [Halomarina oriensis]
MSMSAYASGRRSTPLGIYLVAGLAVLSGLSSVAGGLGHVGSIVGIPLGLLLLAIGMVKLFVGVGLLTRSQSAYRWALWIHGLGGLLDLLGGNLLGTLFAVVVVGYLLSKAAYFE